MGKAGERMIHTVLRIVVRWDGLEISTSIYYCSTLDKDIASADSVVRTNYPVGRGSRGYREFRVM